MPKTVYYSAIATNASTSSAQPAVPCYVVESRQQPLVARCSDWTLSVVRMSTPARALPVYQLNCVTGQSDVNLLDYQVACALTLKTATPPVWPQTLAANQVTMTLVLKALGVAVTGALVNLTAATYNSAADVASAIQTIMQARGGPWTTATCTVESTTPWGRLVLTPPANYVISIQSVTGTDAAAAARFVGFPAQQWNTNTAGPLTAYNAAGLGAEIVASATGTASVKWVAEDASAPTPQPPLIQQDTSSSFYWGWSLSHACSLFNTAYAEAFASAVAQLSAAWWQPGKFPGVTCTAPYITFDAASGLFTMCASAWAVPSLGSGPLSAGYRYPMLEENLAVSMSESADLLFGSWNETTPAGSLGTAQYATQDFSLAPNVNGVVQLRQDSSSLTGVWSPVSSYLVVSNQIPCKGEALSPPFVSTNVGAAAVGVASSFAPIIAEISTSGQPCTVNDESVNYDPFVVREVELTGDGDLSTLDFALLWRDKRGVVRPVLLPAAGSTFSIKICLTKKE